MMAVPICAVIPFALWVDLIIMPTRLYELDVYHNTTEGYNITTKAVFYSSFKYDREYSTNLLEESDHYFYALISDAHSFGG